jgi:hypothetical protein
VAGEAGVVDRLVVAVDYAYNKRDADIIEADFSGLIGLAGALAAALVGATLEAAAAGDEAIKLARAVNLDVESYTELAYAADMAGASQEDLSAALNALTRQMYAAGTGGKEAQQVFAALEIDPRQFEDSADALPAVADALNQIGDEGKRAGLEMKLFGRSGGSLRSFLVGGSDEMRRMGERAHDLRIAISEADAVASEGLMDSLSDLGHIAKGLSRNVGFALVPSLTRAADSVIDWYLANDEVIDQQMDRVAAGIGHALDELQTPTGKAIAAAGSLAAAWGAVGVARSMYTAAAAASPLVAALGGQAGAALAAAKAGGPLVIAAIAVAAALDDLSMAAEGNDSILLRLGETMGAKGETQRAAAGLIDLFWSGVDATTAWNDVIQTKFIGTLGELAAALNPLTAFQPVLDAIGVVVPEIELPSAKQVIGGAADALQGTADLFELGSRAARGELTPTDELVLGSFMEQASGRRAMSQAPQISMPFSLTVQSGSSKEEIARIAGEQARAEVERQTYEALLSAEQSP